MAGLVSLYNTALSMVGGRTLTNPDAALREAELCNQFFPSVRDEVTLEYEWSYAVKTAALALVEETEGPYRFVYQIPGDALRILELTQPSLNAYSGGWEKIGDKIHCSNELSWARYIARIDTVTFIPTHVREAMAIKLAGRLAFPLAQSLQLENALYQRYQITLDNAMHIEGSLKQNRPLEHKRWTEAG